MRQEFGGLLSDHSTVDLPLDDLASGQRFVGVDRTGNVATFNVRAINPVVIMGHDPKSNLSVVINRDSGKGRRHDNHETVAVCWTGDIPEGLEGPALAEYVAEQLAAHRGPAFH